jgi:hypothetical protein
MFEAHIQVIDQAKFTKVGKFGKRGEKLAPFKPIIMKIVFSKFVESRTFAKQYLMCIIFKYKLEVAISDKPISSIVA